MQAVAELCALRSRRVPMGSMCRPMVVVRQYLRLTAAGRRLPEMAESWHQDESDLGRNCPCELDS